MRTESALVVWLEDITPDVDNEGGLVVGLSFVLKLEVE
jgi:hypothetical protein